MKSYTTISGQTVEYDPSPDVAAFIARLEQLAADQTVSENDMILIVYGAGNPIMSADLFPGRGAVTTETLANPAYRVMTDLLFRKHVAEKGIDVEKLAAGYTLSTGDVAERLGIHRSAVQQAIDAGRLAAWVKSGRQYVDPRALATFKLAPRGPKSKSPDTVRASTDPLHVSTGHNASRTLRVRSVGDIHGGRADENHAGGVGTISLWRRVAILTGAGDRAMFKVIEPAEDEAEIKHGEYFVRGKFRVVEKINNAKKASEAFKAFEPA